MNILITGQTGLIGQSIQNLCEKRGYVVHYLTTNMNKIKMNQTLKGYYWNPTTQEVDSNCLEGVEAIINLAGASISKRWTASYKKEIVNSRIQSVKLIDKLLSENSHQVKNIVSASAIGIYPSSGTKKYNESEKEINQSFLGEVVNTWESEIDKLNNLGIKICKLRIGVVLSKQGGALEKMIKPVRYGFGASLASGKQYLSWIHQYDLAEMFLFAIEKKLEGIYNAVAPKPVTNSSITKIIAKKLNRPLWLPNIPSFMLRLLLGEMSVLLLESQKVDNTKILKEGFTFKFNTVESALSDCLI